MKKLLLILVFIPLFSIAQNADSKYYGEKINPENTVKLVGLINHAKENSLAKVSMTRVERRNPELTYNKMSFAQESG